MDFNINNAEAERKKTLKFAEDNGISTDEVEAVYEKIYAELSDDLSENAKELRALRKTRGSLKRIANSSANYIDGFIFMRFRDTNFNEYAWKLVDAQSATPPSPSSQSDNLPLDTHSFSSSFSFLLFILLSLYTSFSLLLPLSDTDFSAEYPVSRQKSHHKGIH